MKLVFFEVSKKIFEGIDCTDWTILMLIALNKFL